MNYNTIDFAYNYKRPHKPQRFLISKPAVLLSSFFAALSIGYASLFIVDNNQEDINAIPLSSDTLLTGVQQATFATMSSAHPILNHLEPTAAIAKIAVANKASGQPVIVQPGDNLSLIFSRLQLDANDLQEIMSLGTKTKPLLNLYPGQELRFYLTNGREVDKLVYQINHSDTLTVSRLDEGGYQALIAKKPVDIRTAFASGIIRDSLFASAQKTGLDTRVILELAEIFAWDIDFSLDIQPNDEFNILYEEQWTGDKKLRAGNILAAEFINNGKKYQAVRYIDKEGTPGYYNPNGMSLRKAFLRSPVKFGRVSSHFNLSRRHPILHRIRAHKGVDYAAARGTPIRAVGDGKIISIAKQNGYGNVIELQHGEAYTTLYAHMDRFAQRLRKGSRIKQGQIIGYVGSTGLATGPHLHYEFRIHGVHKNPLTVQLPRSLPIAAEDKRQFIAHADELMKQLYNYRRTTLVLHEEDAQTSHDGA